MAKEIKKVQLKSSEGEMFEIDEAVAFESVTLKHMIEDTGAEDVLPLPNINSDSLAKVIEFCKYHVEASNISAGKAAISKEDVEKWDQEFVKMDMATLLAVSVAANFLDIKNLVESTTQAVADTVADILKHKSPEDVRKTFNIQNDYSPEEEKETWLENRWAFQ